MTVRRSLAAFLVVLVTACAGTPGPGDPGYLFNVTGSYSGQFSVEGQALPATLELDTAPGGVVTGMFAIAMMDIEGTVEGEIVGNEITWVGSYYNPESGCDGVASATGTIAENGASMEGQVEATECGQYLGGTWRFAR